MWMIGLIILLTALLIREFLKNNVLVKNVENMKEI